MMRALQSAGIFEGSCFIYERGLRRRLREAERLKGLHRLRQLALSSVALGNFDLAEEVLAQAAALPSHPVQPALEDLLEYQAIWTGNLHKRDVGTEFALADNAFAHAVSRRNALFFGPGPGAALPEK